MQIVNDIRAAEDAVAQLVKMGRAELEAAERAEADERKRVEAENARKRGEVIHAIKAAIGSNGQMPAALYPYMKTAGLGDDGECPNGYVTILVELPPHPSAFRVQFKVIQNPNGGWYVNGEWIASGPDGGSCVYPKFAQAVAAEVTNRVPY